MACSNKGNSLPLFSPVKVNDDNYSSAVRRCLFVWNSLVKLEDASSSSCDTAVSQDAVVRVLAPILYCHH